MAKGGAGVLVGVALAAALVTCNVRDATSRAPAVPGLTDASASLPASAMAGRDRAATDRDSPPDAANAPPITTASDLLEGWYRAQREAVQRLARELAARGDAESLLDAALLLPFACYGPQDCSADSAERARLLAAAAKLAPEHPLIAFLQAETCMLTNDCAAAYRRLATVDPDNLFAHLGLLHTASQTRDPAALDRALREAAAAPLYDTYMAELTAELERALRRLPAPSTAVRAQMAASLNLHEPLDEDGARLLQALGVSSGMGFPPLQALLQTCRADSLRQVPANRAPCLTVLARMAASDTTLARSIGLTRLVQLTAATAEAAPWRERLREFAWVYERFLALQSPLSLDHLRLQTQRGEWVAMRELLRRHGVPLQPPAGWLPAQARYRELLSGGG